MREWDRLIIYTSHRPCLHQLNAEAWLVFELADGRRYDEILADYRGVVSEEVPDEAVRAVVDRTLRFLETKEIVHRQPQPSIAASHHEGR